ncbi:MAG: hypothetical protein ACRCU5_13820 [Rhizobiaceae bacterium]
MGSTPYPLPRETRQSDTLDCDGVSLTYGPFTFKIFDVEDVQVLTRPSPDDVWMQTAATVTKVVGLPFDDFKITFATLQPATIEFRVVGMRTHEREYGITKGNQLDTDQLEKELSKQGIVLQEQRRDIDRSLKAPFGQPGKTISPIDPGHLVIADSTGNLVSGPDATDIAGAQANAALATAAAASVRFKSALTMAAALAIAATTYDAVFVSDASRQQNFIWDSGNKSVQIAANDARYIAPPTDPTGASGALVQAGSVHPLNVFSRAQGVRVFREAGRAFFGAAAGFGGEFDTGANMTGLPLRVQETNWWIPRDGTIVSESQVGGTAIVGFSVKSKKGNWPFAPQSSAAIGVVSMVFADESGGANWSWYGEANADAPAGFTVVGEVTVATRQARTNPNPFNIKSGGVTSGVFWVAAGAGRDVVPQSDPWNIKSASSAITFLTSYSEATSSYYQSGQALVIGSLRRDPETEACYRSLAARTPAAALMKDDRLANPTLWQELPGFVTGLLFAPGSVVENTAGSNIHEYMQFPEGALWTVRRRNKTSGLSEISSAIYFPATADGTPRNTMVFNTNRIDFDAADGLLASAFNIGGLTNFATASRGPAINDSVVLNNAGAGVWTFRNGGVDTLYVSTAGLQLTGTKALFIGGNQVVAPRDTGYGRISGTIAASEAAFVVNTLPAAAAAYSQADTQTLINMVTALAARLRAYDNTFSPSGHGLTS